MMAERGRGLRARGFAGANQSEREGAFGAPAPRGGGGGGGSGVTSRPSAPCASRRLGRRPPERLPGGDGHRAPPPASPVRSWSNPARSWRAAACGLLAAFALLLGAGTAEAFSFPRDIDVAQVDKQELKVWFNDLLNTGSLPAGSAFTVRVTPSGGTTRTISGTGTVAIAHNGVTVALASAVSEGERVTVSYTIPAANPLQYLDGAGAAAFSNRGVTNKTDATKPTLAFAKLNGDTVVTLYYDDRLKKDAVPGLRDFLFEFRGSKRRFNGEPLGLQQYRDLAKSQNDPPAQARREAPVLVHPLDRRGEAYPGPVGEPRGRHCAMA